MKAIKETLTAEMKDALRPIISNVDSYNGIYLYNPKGSAQTSSNPFSVGDKVSCMLKKTAGRVFEVIKTTNAAVLLQNPDDRTDIHNNVPHGFCSPIED